MLQAISDKSYTVVTTQERVIEGLLNAMAEMARKPTPSTIKRPTACRVYTEAR
jgi:hypothetical protein